MDIDSREFQCLESYTIKLMLDACAKQKNADPRKKLGTQGTSKCRLNIDRLTQAAEVSYVLGWN